MAYFASSIFLSAFLLFLVEPMIAKYILPWFGGTPAIWSTVLMFFQILLTGGYAYAAWLNGKPRRREWVHLVLLSVSLILLLVMGIFWKSPITPPISWKPQGNAFPIWEICKLLLVSVGLPFFLLSSNSPLIQAWFSRYFPEKSAYRLYALSNVGSLLGLLVYPLLMEPYLPLAWQGRLWALAYGIYAGLAFWGAVKAFQSHREAEDIPEITEVPGQIRPKMRDYLLWIGLAATASCLLLAVTSQITQEVAVIPFLWVLPLTVYLLTFVLSFSSGRWYSRRVFTVIFLIAMTLSFLVLVRFELFPIQVQIGIYLLVLFAACMICHGELYRMRPSPSRLTSFYLMVSAGGALGGIFINFIAPNVFKGFWELPIGLLICWSLFTVVATSSRTPNQKTRIVGTSWMLIACGFLIVGVWLIKQIWEERARYIFSERNYYGVIRVKMVQDNKGSNRRYELVNGITVHGYQFIDKSRRDVPTAYFGKNGGGGLALLNSPKRSQDMRVGILGLGIGTLAAYGQPGDVYRFYEINPSVVRLAEGQGGYFSFLSDSAAKVEIVPGDARISLERELATGQPQNYDVLVLDVFSSDSIPVHLLDAEAFDLYLKQLAPEGILAAHISNLHLNLIPVVWVLADHFGLAHVLINDPGDGVTTYPSLWVLLARDAALLDVAQIRSRATLLPGYQPRIRLWTDDFNNLIQILH